MIVDNLKPIEFLKLARDEAKQYDSELQLAAVGRDQDRRYDKSIRSDRKMFVSRFCEERQSEYNQNFCELINYQRSFQAIFNQFLPQEDSIDAIESMLACYDGEGENFKGHKDAFKIDKNNLKNGQNLRKITMITYLPDENDHISKENVGFLRAVYDAQNIDIRPRIGRSVLFKSERLVHSVLPTRGYKRMALTTWFNHTFRSEQKVGTRKVMDPDGTIFVSIVAYRDSETHYTLKSCIESAENAARLRIAIFIQASREEDAKTCFVDELASKYPKIVKVDEVHYSEARNVFYARSRCQRMYDGETFALQIDSHMRFCQDWDTQLIKQLNSTPCPEKTVISCYPRDYDKEDYILQESAPLGMAFLEFAKDELPRWKARPLKESTTFAKPFKSLFWAAGNSFSAGQLIRDCPYEEEIGDIFFGEELLMMRQFFNTGYELFHPSKNFIYHMWER